MNRGIPGTIPVEGREFSYVEIRPGESFSDLVDQIFASCPTVASPSSGGIIEEKARVALPNDTLLLGMSYKGDLEGWRKKIQGFCKQTGRTFATPFGDKLILMDLTPVAFIDCKISLDR